MPAAVERIEPLLALTTLAMQVDVALGEAGLSSQIPATCDSFDRLRTDEARGGTTTGAADWLHAYAALASSNPAHAARAIVQWVSATRLGSTGQQGSHRLRIFDVPPPIWSVGWSQLLNNHFSAVCVVARHFDASVAAAGFVALAARRQHFMDAAKELIQDRAGVDTAHVVRFAMKLFEHIGASQHMNLIAEIMGHVLRYASDPMPGQAITALRPAAELMAKQDAPEQQWRLALTEFFDSADSSVLVEDEAANELMDICLLLLESAPALVATQLLTVGEGASSRTHFLAGLLADCTADARATFASRLHPFGMAASTSPEPTLYP